MQSAKTKNYNSASAFFDQFKEAFELRNNARFWFGSLLSIADRIDTDKLSMDLRKNQAQHLMHMLNHALADLSFFYQKQPPEETFRFLQVCRKILGLQPEQQEQMQLTYRMKMHQVHFNNTLALFGVKHKQYSFAMECFEKITQMFAQESVDTATDVFLAALSNYLSFLRSYQYSHLSDRIRQVLEYFQDTYQNLLHKYMKGPCDANSIVLMLSVYKQHELFLSKDFKAQNLMLLKKQGIPFSEFPKVLKNSGKIAVRKVGDLKIKRKQLNFFSSALTSHLPKQQTLLKRSSLREARDKSRLPSQQTVHLESVASEILMPTISKQLPQIAPTPKRDENVDLIANLLKKSKFFKQDQKPTPHLKLYCKDQPLTIKANYVMLEFIKEGVVVSDFLKEKKRFFTWSETFKLIKRFRFSGVFSSIFPAYTFYDIGKLLAPYVRKSEIQSSRGFSVCDEPKQFLEISVLMRTFKLEGPYLKIFAMNLYNVERVEFWIDCYLHDFSDFFKQQTPDGYIQHLNHLIFQGTQPSEFEASYSLGTYRKSRPSVKQQLETQLSLDALRDRQDFKNSFFRVLLLMRGSKRILVFYDPKDNKEEQIKARGTLIFSVSEISEQPFKINKLIVPTYKLSRCFPPCYLEQKWMSKLGFFILDAHLHSFINYPTSFVNQKFFNAITYAKKVEMNNAGKYFVPVSAELIGSTTRIWGIVIKFYLQAGIQEETTFIYNPYHQLFSQAIKLNPIKRRQLLENQLLEGSVKKTYKRIVEKNLREKIISISDYWDMMGF